MRVMVLGKGRDVAGVFYCAVGKGISGDGGHVRERTGQSRVLMCCGNRMVVVVV